MSKFIKENDEPLIYEEIFNEVDRNLFPFEAILKNQNLSDIIYNDISLDKLIRLNIAIKGIGNFIYFIAKDNYDRYDFINKLSFLKSEEEDKLTQLKEVMKGYQIYFLIYKQGKDSNLKLEQLEQDTPTFIIKYNEELDKEVPVVIETKKEEVQEKRSLGRNIRVNRYHLLIVIISSLLIYISLSLGILNYILQIQNL